MLCDHAASQDRSWDEFTLSVVMTTVVCKMAIPVECEWSLVVSLSGFAEYILSRLHFLRLLWSISTHSQCFLLLKLEYGRPGKEFCLGLFSSETFVRTVLRFIVAMPVQLCVAKTDYIDAWARNPAMQRQNRSRRENLSVWLQISNSSLLILGN